MRCLRSVVWPAAVLAAVVTMLGLPAASVQAGTAGAVPGLAGGRLSLGLDVATPGSSFLSGVYCTAAANCWAVGQRQSGPALLNQVLHWNGKTWRRGAVPSPGGTSSTSISELYAVRCLSAGNCWAVGEYTTTGKFYLGEALHWNGRKWSTTPVPATGGTGRNDVTELFDSTCTSADSCWAVGDYGLGMFPAEKKLLNLVLHWNGRKWTRTPAPNPAGIRLADINALSTVRCGSAADCNAVGEYGNNTKNAYLNETLHWNGTRWSRVPVPNPGGTGRGALNVLYGLGCGSPTSCWAVGEYYLKVGPFFPDLNEILHWNGRSWTRVTAVPEPDSTKPGGGEDFLLGAVCSSAANCWAVGQYRAGQAAALNQALHWNGRHWAYVATPSPGGTGIGDLSSLEAARCTSSSNCWAVGYVLPEGGAEAGQILHWNGKKWSVWT
jgi:hypothetical protein